MSASDSDHDDMEQPTGNGASSDASASPAPVPTTEAASQNSDLLDNDDAVDDDDLFGDGGDEDEEPQPAKQRRLSDSELDSGDDQGRADRVGYDEEPDIESEEDSDLNFLDLEIPKAYEPEPSDNELYLMRVPKFFAFEPKAFDYNELSMPTTDHHSRGPPSSSFSAYKTAITTIRWRRSPSDQDQLQSNARLLRWSDGSLTLQFASDPLTQYEMDPRSLVPPQANPPKPTPTSQKAARPGRNKQQTKDAHTYLAVQSPGFLRLTNKLTASLAVLPTADTEDNALAQLTAALKEASSRKQDAEAAKMSTEIAMRINEDPELIRKRAEAAEKEKMRAQRRREAQEMRERERSSRVFGRSMGRSAGLTVGGLEDDIGAPMRHRKANRPRQRRRGGIESDEEESFGRRFTREDEYDEEDDFLAPSDEEEEIVEDDDEEILDDGDEDDEPRERSPKRSRVERDVEEDDDAAVAAPGRSKRRRVIDEDDEDE